MAKAKLFWHEVSIRRALMAGLFSALLNGAAIKLVKMAGIPSGTGGLSKMMVEFANSVLTVSSMDFRLPNQFGPIGQEVFHTVMGILMALIYCIFFYPILRGPGWLRGLLFSQFPWVIQVFVVLPWMGAGVLGLRLSPVTPIISFLLNSLYGLMLGWLYWPPTRQRVENRQRKESSCGESLIQRSSLVSEE